MSLFENSSENRISGGAVCTVLKTHYHCQNCFCVCLCSQWMFPTDESHKICQEITYLLYLIYMVYVFIYYDSIYFAACVVVLIAALSIKIWGWYVFILYISLCF